MAVGAKSNDGTGTDAGHVRVYQLSGSSWTQLGADIDGEAAGDNSGSSVALTRLIPYPELIKGVKYYAPGY